MPWVSGGAVALAGLLGAIAFLLFAAFTGSQEISRLQAGVILPENDEIAKQAISMLGSLESIESICDFVYTDMESAKEKMKTGELDLLLVVPEQFVSGIINGTNEPVTIVFPNENGIEEQIFKELADAGAKTLGSAQAGIYAADQFCILKGTPETIKGAEDWLNRQYLKYSLDRTVYFRDRRVSAFGDVSGTVHYGAAAAVLFLLFCGIPAAELFQEYNVSCREKLNLLGIGRGKRTAARAAAMWLLLLVSAAVLAVFLFLLSWIGGWQESLFRIGAEAAPGLGEQGMGGVFTVAAVFFAAASLITLCYRAVGTGMGGRMALFGLTAGMMFLSGGFLPEVFLPESFRKLSPFLPTSILMDGVKGLFLPESIWEKGVAAGLLGLAALILACAGKGERQ